jgi:hypothetical protein
MLQKICIFILVVFSSFGLTGQNVTEQKNVMLPIEQLFKGMSLKDTFLIRNTFYSVARLATTGTDKTGAAFFKQESVNNFISSIGGIPTATKLEERLLSHSIQIDDNLAIVRTPYEFYVNDNFSHCGVNVFELFKTPYGWRITSIIDTRKKENCPKE